MLTQKQLQELLHYNTETGDWTWLVSRRGHTKKGAVAGRLVGKYWAIKVNQQEYYAHRLAFFYMTAKWPDNQVDHVDRNGLNNKWSNLRLATGTQNQGNRGLNKNNTSGYKGVCWDKACNKWWARVGRKISLGHFDDPYEAHLVYEKAAKEYFGEYT